MKSSHWTIQNNTVLYAGLAITGVITALMVIIFQSPGPERSWFGLFISTIVLIGGISVTMILKNRDVNLMKRTLKMEYTAAEFALRKMFKNKYIRFHRQVDEDFYIHIFEFPGHSLTMIIQPYDLKNGIALGRDAFSRQIRIESLGTLVTLRDLNTSDRAFADKLAESIDEIANQRLNN